MADKASDGLPYGQFGKAVYGIEDGSWSFGRSTQRRLLLPIAPTETIAKPTAEARASPAGDCSKDAPSRRREKQTKALIQSVPELQPASGILPDYARVSEVVEEAASQSNSSKGQLIAHGEIYDESRRGCIGAIAFPSGPTGSDLRIIQGLQQRQGWNRDRSSWIETLDFTGVEGRWSGPGVSILSIVFARPLDRGGHYLAVRLPMETLIFRPVLKKHATPDNLRLNPNLLFSIGTDETRRLPHAHMTFNPWFTGQLAIVDQAGCWSVWETGRKSSEARKIKSGLADDEAKPRGLDDGWARVLWVEGASTLCTATRRRLVLMDLEAVNDAAPVEVDTGLKKGIVWILDLGTVPGFSNHMFVLTSAYICVFHVERVSDGRIMAELMLQVRHYRSPGDSSLSMHLCAGADDVFLILRSAINPMISQFCFDLADPDSVRLQSPVAFKQPQASHQTDVLDCFLDHLPLVSKDKNFSEASSSDCVFNFYTLGKDLRLSRTLFAPTASNRHCQNDSSSATGWLTKVSKPKKKGTTTFGGFIDNDGDEKATSRRHPLSQYVSGHQGHSTSRSTNDWTVSYERLAQMLNQVDIESYADIDEIIEDVSILLRSQTPQLSRPVTSLHEVANALVDVNDLEGASERLQGLHAIRTETASIEGEQKDPDSKGWNCVLKVIGLTVPAANNVLGLPPLESLTDTVDAMRQNWSGQDMSPAFQTTSAVRDLHISRMAAEITLASRHLRLEESQQNEVDGDSPAWDLPVRLPPAPAQGSSHDALSSQYVDTGLARTPALPTPSASASTITGSSHPSGFAAPEVARLSKYTTFSKDAPPSLPRVLNNVLSHWIVGTSLAEYDWQSTARQVSRRAEEADDEMTEKERRRMERRTERYIRRQRREAEESQRQQMLSSQAPEIVSASQPASREGLGRAVSQVSAGAGAAAGSSQSYGLSRMAASQVVRGRHGGRAPPKKKRKSGF